jgi:hypothetical protein
MVDSEDLRDDFLALDTSAASMTLAASKTSTASKPFFLKNIPDLDDFIPPWNQNDQKWCLFVDWILENPTFGWYLTLFLSEAVEASQYHVFEN